MIQKTWNTCLYICSRMKLFLKWILLALLSGVVIGAVGTLFYYCMKYATEARGSYPWLLFFLPLGGIVIVASYQLLHYEKNTGTNLVLTSIQSDEQIPLKMAPLIFLSTVLTHLFGGSAGREGAALQLGGSIGNTLGRCFHFDKNDLHIMTMCGMSAAFSALFGTPVAAAVFALEVANVGIMYYSALVPCVISSLAAHGIALFCGIRPEQFRIDLIPDFTIATAAKAGIFALFCAGVSILFCIVLHSSESIYKKYLKNPYIRIAAGGCIVLLLTLLTGSSDYNGAGMSVIERCFENEYVPYAFLLKILFTSLTLGAGYKGGEIVPTLFVGATFGCLFGNIAGFSPALCSALGMGGVFCGVTNCPITSLLICFELFGFRGSQYFLLVIAISYTLSGYYGLYHSQNIVYSKYKKEFINRRTH